jgi:hypothetical protein
VIIWLAFYSRGWLALATARSQNNGHVENADDKINLLDQSVSQNVL